MKPFWIFTRESSLCQGDLLPGCWIPRFPADFSEILEEARVIQAEQADLIIITQSCDLEQAKTSLVAMCPVWSIPAFEQAQTNSGRAKSARAWADFWNNVRKGRSPTLHLLASPTDPTNARAALLVDFRAIYSLPVEYLLRHATQIGDRWRLRSPFLEHFSQAFARSFMRVGLPSSVPEF
jgi:hypothetical protein